MLGQVGARSQQGSCYRTEQVVRAVRLKDEEEEERALSETSVLMITSDDAAAKRRTRV